MLMSPACFAATLWTAWAAVKWNSPALGCLTVLLLIMSAGFGVSLTKLAVGCL
jgi:hypothetical protein